MTAIAPSPLLLEQPAFTFNFPVATDSAQAMGALLNYILSIAVPVGTIIDTLLTPTQMQGELGAPFPYTWVLADGSSIITSVPNSPSYSVSLSKYFTTTGFTSIPDCRGIMRRGKNNGRSDGKQNPAGDLALGSFMQDLFASHDHVKLFDQASNSEWGQSGDGGSTTLALLQGFPGMIIFPIQQPQTGPSSDFYTGQAGSLDTSPKNVPVNSYIRIN